MDGPLIEADLDECALMAAVYSSDALAVMDTQSRILWVNRAFEELTGYTFEELRGKRPREMLLTDWSSDQQKAQIDHSLELRRPISTEIKGKRKDGSPLALEIRISPIFDDDGRHTYFMSSSRDVTERRAMEQATKEATENEHLRQQERRLLSQVSEWLYSAKSLDELLMVISRSLETLMPEAEGQLYIYSNSRDTLDLNIQWGGMENAPRHIEPDDCWALRRGRAYSYGMRPIEFPCGHSHAAEDDSPYFCIPITAHGQTNGLLHLDFGAFAPERGAREKFRYFLEQRWELALLCAEQISLAIANVQLRQELLDQSVRDPLTNLWNRRWFLEAMHRQIGSSQKAKIPCSIISIDVDHFKKFNDHHGHDAGDHVLRAIGARMIEVFTESCSPCRLGGEEFVVLCAHMDEDECYEIAEDFRQQVSDIAIKYSGAELPRITVSAGVATWPEDGANVVDLMKSADIALYSAKENGRNQVVKSSELNGA